MALKEFKLDLSKASVEADNVFSGASTVTITTTGGKEEASATVVGSKQNSVKLNGFGILNATATAKVATFVADTALKTGAYTASFDTTAGNATSLKSFDASRASASLSLTTSLVSVDGGELKGGSGNDTIFVEDNGATDLKIFGGKGADTFEVKSTSAKVTIADYNYDEGDKISIASTDSLPAFGGFATNGQVTVEGAATTVVSSEADGVYKFGFIDENKKKYDYVAAATGADVNYTAGTDTLYFKADGSSGSVVVDASKAANASIQATVKDANITLGGTAGSQNSVVAGLNATDSSVFVDLGYGTDIVSVASANTALTLKVGREDGLANELRANTLDANDTLVLTTGKITDISMDSIGALKFGATSIKGAFSTTSVGAFNVQFGSDKAKTLAYTGKDDVSVGFSKDVSYYLGAGRSKVSVANNNTDNVVLDMVNFTNGIVSVDVDKANAANDKVAVDIIAKADTSINANVDHANAEWKFDLTANKDNEAGYLDLGTKGVDRIVLSDAKGNKDSVKGFVAGEDILVLSDVDKLTEKTFSVTNSTDDVKLQNSEASIDGAFVAGTNLDVVLSDGAAKKVALADATAKVVATQETTTVINQTDKDGIVKFDIDEATENNAAFVVDMTGTVSNAIDYLGKFTSIDATVDAANALIVGNEAITNIKVTGSADHGAAVWAGAKANAEIDLSATPNHAGNIIWTGALDGASSVKGFEDKDKLYVYGVDGLSKTAVAESFGINDTDITYHTGASSMTFLSTPSGNIDVMYMDSTAKGGYGYKKVSFNTTASGNVAYNTDVDVYIGTANATVTVSNDAVAEGDLVAINLSNKGAGSVEEGGAYYKGIHNIDASASAGTFLLIGDNSNGAKLKGGAKGNAIWGGGDASQNMTGFAGVADIFWFGSKDGHDVVTNFGTKDGASGDAVFLYDATSIDAVQITAEGNAAKVVFKNTNSTLTLDKVSNIDDVKFMLNNADGGYDYYKYDSKTSAFVQQKA